MQLDISTLALLFITQGITSSVVMFLLWRINRDLPGVQFWLWGTVLNVASAMSLLISSLLGWPEGWTPFLSNSISLPAGLFVLEGTLRFRGFHSRRRWPAMLMLIPFFVLMSWINRHDPAARFIFHDTFSMAFHLLAGIVWFWKVREREELFANMMAGLSSLFVVCTMSVRWWLALTGNAQIMNGTESWATQWYLFFGVVFHVGWVFGLSVACYYRSRQQVLQLAREDALTTLPNRRSIDERLGQALSDCRRSGERFGVIMLDVNDFKAVNDTYGHSVGDRLLQWFAKRLQTAVRESDFAGRLGGDEFIVVARHVDDQHDLDNLVRRLRNQLNGEFMLPDGLRPVAVSMGAVVCPEDGQTADALMGAADARMYRDKARIKEAVRKTMTSSRDDQHDSIETSPG